MNIYGRLGLVVSFVFLLALSPAVAQQVDGPRFKAIAFDAFPVFDPRPVARLAEEVYPGRGAELMAAWRTRQFEYQWQRALGGRYVDFMQATADSLEFAIRSLDLELTDADRQRLLGAYMNLTPWPDAIAAIRILREAGVRLVFLSNMTEEMLQAGLANAGLGEEFEMILSTDRIRSYKPDPAAYRLGTEELGVDKKDILFVAFAGWDVAGAEWFGYPTFWVNRLGSPMEELGVESDAAGSDLDALVSYVLEGD